jgi:hypothetical protein
MIAAKSNRPMFFRREIMMDIRFKADKRAEFENLHVEWEVARRHGIVWKRSRGPMATAWVDEEFVYFLKKCGFPFTAI